MHGLARDLRTFLRGTLRRPGYALVVVITLALAIGASTAIFSVAHGVLLRPLPYDGADRLVTVKASFSGTPPSASIAGPMLVEMRRRTKVFERLEALWIGSNALEGESGAEQVETAWVTPGMLDLLGADPAAGGTGRRFADDETVPNGPRTTILSHGLWERRFGGDTGVLGTAVRFGGTDWTVIGVMPPTLRVVLPGSLANGADIDAWMAMDVINGQTLAEQNPEMLWLRVLGVLDPGVSLQQAAAEMHAVARALQDDYEEYAGSELDFHVVPVHREIVEDVETGLLALMGAVGFVLVIACANVANLALARTCGIERELALRAALGSSRGRLVLTGLAENLLLALVGGALGVLLAGWGLDLLLALRPPNLPRLSGITLDRTVLLFSLGTSVLTGLLFGVVPAWRSLRLDLNNSLKQAGTAVASSRSHQGLRRGLVVAEVALSMILLAGAGLMMQSFLRLADVQTGFQPENAVTFEISLPGARYAFPEARDDEPGETGAWEFFGDLSARIDALPGVETVGAVSHIPLGGRSFTVEYWRDPDAETPGARASAHERTVAGDYFAAMGIRLLSGRVFGQADDADSDAIIVDRRLAAHVWPQGDAVGRRLRFNIGTQDTWGTVVGVVDHVRHDELTREGLDQIYLPFRKNPFNRMTFVVRAGSDPATLIPAIRSEVAALDLQLPMFNVKTMTDYVNEATAFVRYPLILMGIFAAVALTLAAVGIYGTLSYLVGLRTREIGIRLAIGAASADIRNLVLRQGLLPAAVGVGGGLVGGLALTRLLGNLLYDISPADPFTFGGIALTLAVVATLACWVPSRRAVRIDPTLVLRD